MKIPGGANTLTNFLASAFGAPFIRDGQRAGRGQYLKIVVATGGVAVTKGHTLGRTPTMLILFDAGNNAFPGYTWPIASRTSTQFSITFPVAGTYYVWVS